MAIEAPTYDISIHGSTCPKRLGDRVNGQGIGFAVSHERVSLSGRDDTQDSRVTTVRQSKACVRLPRTTSASTAVPANVSHTMYFLNGFRKSTPPQKSLQYCLD